jgi:hypothetical protein
MSVASLFGRQKSSAIPASHNYARPAIMLSAQPFLCSAAVIPSSRPCTTPTLPRAGDVKDGAAAAKGGLSLTAPGTVACWMLLGPRKFDAARRALLLFGMGTAALPVWDEEDEAEPSGGRPYRCSDGRHKQQSDLASSFVPRGTPSARAADTSLCVSVSMQLGGCYQAAAASSFVQRNSVPSTQMRCMMTASLRASATMARFSPRLLAIFMAQALSHDHLTLRVRTVWAPS